MPFDPFVVLNVIECHALWTDRALIAERCLGFNPSCYNDPPVHLWFCTV